MTSPDRQQQAVKEISDARARIKAIDNLPASDPERAIQIQRLPGLQEEVAQLLVELNRLAEGAPQGPAGPSLDASVPEWLSNLFEGLPNQRLQERLVTWEGQVYGFRALPFPPAAPLVLGGQEHPVLYMLPMYTDAIRLLVGDSGAAMSLGSDDAATPPVPGTVPAHTTVTAGKEEQQEPQEKRARVDSSAKRSSGGGSSAGSSSGSGSSAGREATGSFYLLMGIAGVGKTCFLYVLAWVLSRTGKTIMIHLRSYKDVIFVFRPGQPAQGMGLRAASKLLANKENWYLCDCLEPVTDGVLARTVLTASPKAEEAMNTFRKHSSEIWFGPWTLTELLCGNAVSAHDLMLEPSEVAAQYATFGGSARSVLLKDRRTQLQLKEKLTDLIYSAKTSSLINAMSAKSFREDMSNTIFHVTVRNEPFPLSRGPIIFASGYVGTCLLGALKKKGKSEVLQFMLACQKHGIMSAAAGYLYEAWIDQALQEGGSFNLLHLDSGIQLRVKLPELKLHTFKQLEEVGAEGQTGVWVPDSRENWPVADHYVVIPDPVLSGDQLTQLGEEVRTALATVRTFMVQTTVAASHRILAHRYEEQSKQLGTTLFVWAVPEDSQLQKPQPLVTTTGNPRQRSVAIHQFALLVPLQFQLPPTQQAAS